MFATDSNGAVVWTASYLPFGGVHASTGDPIKLCFPGQWFQSESGLHQNWMRDYDPTTGRYMQADPLGLVDGVSVYGYARQNPGRWTDPWGRQTGVLDGRGQPLYEIYDPFNQDGSAGGGGISGAAAAAALAAALGNVHESQMQGVGLDGSTTTSMMVVQPTKQRGRFVCNCRAQCNGNIPDNCPDPNGFAFAHGSASANDLPSARILARKNAESKLQCQGKHTTCKCTSPKGDRFND